MSRSLVRLSISLLFFTAIATSGCLTLMGGSQRVGDRAAEQVEREQGVIEDPQLAGYVRTMGERLATVSKREGPWSFKIIDDPIPNAFALPGGHIYVTRGLLVLVNSEDELAGVVGHEIGHVLAGHSGKRVTLSAPFAIVTGITSFATGIVSPSLGDAIASGGGALSQGLVIAPFSRSQEREADRIGQKLAADAGWDPAAMSGFLDTLGRATVLITGEERRASWLDTHPATPDRVEQTAANAKALEQVERAPIAKDRRDLLGRLDGLMVGRDVGHGTQVGDRHVQPTWRASIAFPEGWVSGGNAYAMAGQAPGGDAMALLGREAAGNDPRAAVRAMEEKAGGKIETEEVKVGGKPGLRATGRERGIYYEAYWVAVSGSVLRLMVVCKDSQADAWRPTFASVVGSLRAASQSELAAVRQPTLRSTQARGGESAAQVAARTKSVWEAEAVEVVNGVATGHHFASGDLVKVALGEPFVARR